jgi:hypothetical protein
VREVGVGECLLISHAPRDDQLCELARRRRAARRERRSRAALRAAQLALQAEHLAADLSGHCGVLE